MRLQSQVAVSVVEDDKLHRFGRAVYRSPGISGEEAKRCDQL